MYNRQFSERAREAALKCFQHDPSHYYKSYLCQKLLTGELESSGPYFPTELLKEFGDISGYIVSGNQIKRSIEYSEQYAAILVEEIQKLGFRKIAFLSSGRKALVFKTVSGADNKQQILVISPDHEVRIPSPLVLPEIKCNHAISIRTLIRVMPALDTQNVTDAHVHELAKLVKTSGLLQTLIRGGLLDPVRKDNVGLYTYYNEDEQKEVTIPMVLDWGSVQLKEGGDLEKLQKQWESMPELKLWRDAVAHIQKQTAAENVLDNENLERIARRLTGHEDQNTPSPETSRLVGLIKSGFYPEEISAASEHALAEIEEGTIPPEDYMSRLVRTLTDDKNDKSSLRKSGKDTPTRTP